MANSDYQSWTWMQDAQGHARLHVGIRFDEHGDPDRSRVEWHGGSAEFEPARTCGRLSSGTGGLSDESD